jgi:hypothetical protein
MGFALRVAKNKFRAKKQNTKNPRKNIRSVLNFPLRATAGPFQSGPNSRRAEIGNGLRRVQDFPAPKT